MAESTAPNTTEGPGIDKPESQEMGELAILTGLQTERQDRQTMRRNQRGDDERYQAVEDKLAETTVGVKVDGRKASREYEDDMDNSVKWKTQENHYHYPPPESMTHPKPNGNGLSTIAKTLVAAGIGAGLLGTGAGAFALGQYFQQPAASQSVDTDTQAIYEGSGQ